MIDYLFDEKKKTYIVVLKCVPIGKKAPKKKIIAEFKTEIEACAAKKMAEILLNENFIPNNKQINTWIQRQMSIC
tara:strand:+ start:250 stop:474 length:225 start_codon:yes stop_codon:yes gene_type:complete